MEQQFQFISKYLRGQDLPEGQPIPFTVAKNVEGKCWGHRESKGQFGAEVIMPSGEKKKVEFFLCLIDQNNQMKEFTRNSKGFWTNLQELDLVEGEKITIIRVGVGRDSRYSITKKDGGGTQSKEIPVIEEKG